MTDPTMHPTGSPEQPAPGTEGATAPPPVHHERRSRAVGWRSKDVLRTAGLIVGIYLILKLLWVAHELFFVVFLGTLFGLAVAAAVDRLERFKVPRGVGAALVVVGFLALLFGFGAWMAPTLKRQSHELRAKLPEAVDKAESWINSHQGGLIGMMIGSGESDSTSAGSDSTSGAKRDSTAVSSDSQSPNTTASRQDSVKQGTHTASSTTTTESSKRSEDPAEPKAGSPAEKLKAKLSARIGGATHFLFPFLSTTLAAFGGVLLIIFLSIYIGAEPTLYRGGLMHLFPRRARDRAGEVLAAMGVALRKWLVTQLIAMAVIGGVSTIALLILRVKAAFALGLLAGLFEFIPTVGPILSAVPAVAMGFLDSPQKAVIIIAVYFGIQFLENHLLIPLLMRGGVDLPPALTVVTQALMALVFGFIGLMVAVPLLAAVMVPIKMLYVQDVVGDQIDALDEGEDDD